MSKAENEQIQGLLTIFDPQKTCDHSTQTAMKKTLLFLLSGSTFTLYAQNNTVASGGQAAGIGGSASYTIGQIVNSSLTGSNGSLIQGLQQPYEISIVTSTTDLAFDINAQVYPNPTTDQLVLNIVNQELKNLRYILVDIQGKTIASDRINKSASRINMSSLSNGTYFLRVFSNKQQVKSFQIIKNK